MSDLPGSGPVIEGLWRWLPLLPLAIWLAHAAYQRTRPPISPRNLRVLWLLRAATLSVLLLLLIEPLVTWVSRRSWRPVLVTLVDVSASMHVQEGDSTRFARVREALDGALGQHLAPGPVLGFSGEAAPFDLDTLARLVPVGEATDLASALQVAARTTGDQQRAAGILLLSDGGYNLGDDPVAAAAELGIPVQILGVGTTADPDDIQIVAARSAGEAFAGRPARVEVELRAWGYSGSSVDVIVEEEGRLLIQQAVALQDDGQLQQLRLTLPPLEAGPHLLRVQVKAQSGELTPHNNQTLMSLRVRQERLQVLLVAGGPDPDAAFLKRLLSADSSLTVSAAVRRDASRWYGDVTVPPADWNAYDAVLLIDPGPMLPVAGLQAFVSGGGGLLLLAGARTDLGPGEPLAQLLPLELAAPMSRRPGRQPLEIDPGGAGHPLSRALVATGNLSTDPWQRLPPMVLHYAPVRASAAATSLLRDADNNPLVLAGNLGQGRVLAALGSGFWRQSLFARAAGGGTDVVGAFWGQAVRWLALAQPAGRVRVSAARPVYRAGQPVEISAEVFDELSQPMEQARVVLHTDEGREAVMEAHGAGHYRSILSGMPPGGHKIAVRATAGGTTIGEASERVVVESYTVESADQRARPEVLAAIARASGGDYRPLADWRDLSDRLRPPPSLVMQERRLGVEVRHIAWLGVLVALLAAEWILRKRAGML